MLALQKSKVKVTTAQVVSPIDGSEGVGLALRKVTKDTHADAVVVGSRGIDQFSKCVGSRSRIELAVAIVMMFASLTLGMHVSCFWALSCQTEAGHTQRA